MKDQLFNGVGNDTIDLHLETEAMISFLGKWGIYCD